MATNWQTKNKIADMERMRDVAKRHMEAAIDMAIGYKEAGCPKVYTIGRDTYGLLDNTVVPTSWYFASRAKMECNELEVCISDYKYRREIKDYSWAQKTLKGFMLTYSEILYNAERAVSHA
jgi:hypothetical protein